MKKTGCPVAQRAAGAADFSAAMKGRQYLLFKIQAFVCKFWLSVLC